MLSNPCRLFDVDTIITMVQACVTLHNMFIEDERDADEYELENVPDGEFKFVRPDFKERAEAAITFRFASRGHSGPRRGWVRLDILEFIPVCITAR